MRRLLALVAVGCMLLLSACAARDAVDDAAPVPHWDVPLTPSWTLPVNAVSHPRVVDGVVVAYVTGEDQGAPTKEFLTAWDLATGEELWRHEAAPGKTPPTIGHEVAVLERDDTWFVAFLAPRVPHPSQIMRTDFRVVRVDTGEDAATELQTYSVSAQRPTVCHDGEAFCIVGEILGSPARNATFFYEPGATQLVYDESEDAPYGGSATHLGAGISIDEENRVHFGRGGAERWTRDIEDIFGVGASPRGGFGWHLPDDDEAPLLGAGRAWHPHDDGPFTEPLTDGRVVGLDPHTGETVWAIDGARTCATEGNSLNPEDGIVVVCVYRSGTVTGVKTGDEFTEFEYHDVDLDLVGVSVDTGDTVWTVPLGGDAATAAHPLDDGADLLSGSAHVLAHIDGTARIVDSETGETSPIDADAVLICSAPARTVPIDNDGRVIGYTAPGGVRYCDQTGEVMTDAPLSEGALTLVGANRTWPIAQLVDSVLTVYEARE